MATVEDRVSQLESTLAKLTGGAIVPTVVILGYVGSANWYQVPKEITTKVDEIAVEQVPLKRQRFEDFVVEMDASHSALWLQWKFRIISFQNTGTKLPNLPRKQ